MRQAREDLSRERAWVEVDTAALVRNFQRLRRSVGPSVKLIPMVKADGYGLGAERVAKALRSERPFGYGVAAVEEAAVLRRAGIRAPILVHTPLPPGCLARALGLGVVPSVSDRAGLAALRELAESGRFPAPVSFQVEIDTGMGRSGFPLSGAADGWWSAVRSAASGSLRLLGVFTHLHSADEPDLTSARRQVERFEEFVGTAEGIGPDALVHFANSAACLRLPSRVANAARPGIYLYGGRAGTTKTPPEPVAAVRARIVLVRDVPPHSTAGYGAAYRARRRERWATVAIGYGDGLPRALGNRGGAIVGGRPAPIVGRISMDVTVVRLDDDAKDLRAPSASPGDAVTFMGSAGEAALHLDDVAKEAGTIGYEILTGLSPRLPRVAPESCPAQGNHDEAPPKWNA